MNRAAFLCFFCLAALWLEENKAGLPFRALSRTPGDLQHVPRPLLDSWCCCLWHLSAFLGRTSQWAPLASMLRCGWPPGEPRGGFPWQMERLCVPLPLLRARAPSTPATTSCSASSLLGFCFQLSAALTCRPDHHVCPYHDSLQPKELRTGLTPQVQCSWMSWSPLEVLRATD